MMSLETFLSCKWPWAPQNLRSAALEIKKLLTDFFFFFLQNLLNTFIRAESTIVFYCRCSPEVTVLMSFNYKNHELCD